MLDIWLPLETQAAVGTTEEQFTWALLQIHENSCARARRDG